MPVRPYYQFLEQACLRANEELEKAIKGHSRDCDCLACKLAGMLPATWYIHQQIGSGETPVPKKPLCIGCKWIATGFLPDPLYPKCNHREAEHSLVDGEPGQMCAGLRIDPEGFGANLLRNHYCGPEGRWFEAKDETP